MCWKCLKDIDTDDISFTSVCSVCSYDLHCCKNCLFYSPGSHFDCRETIEEIVTDKERGNFCEYFKAKKSFIDNNKKEDKAQKAKDAFNSLFSI